MVQFSKWQGLGNDFILVEPEKNRNVDFRNMAGKLCDRHFGIGGDGVVTIRPLRKNEFEMRIYNSDGSEAEMCGNVSRCVGLYIKKNGLATGYRYILHTLAGPIGLHILQNETVKVDMGSPRRLKKEIPVTGTPEETADDLVLKAGDRTFLGTGVSMGNPHVVIFVPSIKDIELEHWGKEIENSPLFPQKTNVEFVEILSPTLVRMRVWERGCGVTMACGTGCCATAVSGVVTGRTERCLTVLLDGGELQIEYNEQDNHVYMTGPAREIFQGIYMDRK